MNKPRKLRELRTSFRPDFPNHFIDEVARLREELNKANAKIATLTVIAEGREFLIEHLKKEISALKEKVVILSR